MNFFAGCAQLLEDPREVFTGASSTAMRCMISLPAVSNKKADTPIELNIYGKTAERFARLKKNMGIYLHDATLRYDLDTRQLSLHGGVVGMVNAETFPILNTVILSGRCVKDVNHEDERAFKTTPSGLMILAVKLSKMISMIFGLSELIKDIVSPLLVTISPRSTSDSTGL